MTRIINSESVKDSKFWKKDYSGNHKKKSDAQKGKKKSKEHIENMVIAQKKRSESPIYTQER